MILAQVKMPSLRHPHPACGTPLPLGEWMGVKEQSLSVKHPLSSWERAGVRVQSLANLPARRLVRRSMQGEGGSAEREGGRGLGYGG